MNVSDPVDAGLAKDAPRAEGEFGIRRARPDEAAALSALALRSKGHWGYDADFLEACRDDLTLSEDHVATSLVYVCGGPDGPAGFYTLLERDDEAVLDDLFVDPAAIGQGVGRRLWQHAVVQAAALGSREMTVQSDPHAEGFYLAMGARRVGDLESTVTPGRMLPLLRYTLGEGASES